MSDEIQRQPAPQFLAPPADFRHDPVHDRRFRRRFPSWLWVVLLLFVVLIGFATITFLRVRNTARPAEYMVRGWQFSDNTVNCGYVALHLADHQGGELLYACFYVPGNLSFSSTNDSNALPTNPKGIFFNSGHPDGLWVNGQHVAPSRNGQVLVIAADGTVTTVSLTSTELQAITRSDSSLVNTELWKSKIKPLLQSGNNPKQ